MADNGTVNDLRASYDYGGVQLTAEDRKLQQIGQNAGSSADPSTPASDKTMQTVSGSGVQQTLIVSASEVNKSSPVDKTQDTPGAPGDAPPKADAAPKTSDVTATGLCEFLNKHQQKLVKDGVYEVADVYQIVFSPPTLGASKMAPQGVTNTARTGMQDNKTAKDKVDPKTNSMKTTVRTQNLTAGQQIIQAIDQVMKNSSYITDQQLFIYDKDGKEIPNPDNKNGQTAWYVVHLQATPIKYDNKRGDYAYTMTYVVSPYQINNMQSQYFPKSGFRGLHKSYKYWFTGQNTEVINFEQNFNNLYALTMSGNNTDPQLVSNDSREITRKIFQSASAQSMQGGNDKSAEPAANAADYLYSPSDQMSIKMQIVGDPAWLEQGSVTSTDPKLPNVNFEPFLPDGAINVNSQQVCFDISWNKPEDYNLTTGLVPVTEKNRYGGAAIDSTYVAIKTKSTFSRGVFQQEIEGTGLVEFFENNKNNVGAVTPTSNADGRQTTQNPTTSSSNDSSTDGTGAAQSPQNSPPTLTTSNGETVEAFVPDNSFPRPGGDTTQEMALDP